MTPLLPFPHMQTHTITINNSQGCILILHHKHSLQGLTYLKQICYVEKTLHKHSWQI